MKDTYKLAKTYTDAGAIIRVYVPELSADERKRRFDQIRNAAARMVAR